LVTCPNCGHSNLSTQKFCGNCGTDIQAALAPQAAPVSEQQPAPYAYSQPTGFGYEPYAEPQRSVAPRLILIGGIMLIALCCALACGLLLGFELIPDLLGIGGGVTTPKPTPRFTPTPQSMMFIIRYLIG